MIRNRLARHVLEDSVETAINRHDGEPFELRTVEALVEVTPADAERMTSAQRTSSTPRSGTHRATDAPQSAPASEELPDGPVPTDDGGSDQRA